MTAKDDAPIEGGPALKFTEAAQACLPDWEFSWEAEPEPSEFGPSHWARWRKDGFAIGEVGYCEYMAMEAGNFLRDEFGALTWRRAEDAAAHVSALLKSREVKP